MSAFSTMGTVFYIPASDWPKKAAENGWSAFDPAYPNSPFPRYDELWRPAADATLTGAGRVLGILDQPLLCDHFGYKDSLLDVQTVRGVDPYNSLEKENVSSHGAAVVSIAADKNVGIAPDVKIVYRAHAPWVPGERLHNHFSALENMKAYVKDGNPLDAISTSQGWKKGEPWAKETDELVGWFEKRNIPVFSVNSIKSFVLPCGPYGFCYDEQKEDQRYSHLSLKEKISLSDTGGKVAIPIDSRGLACWHPGQQEFLGADYYREIRGGMSWAVPFVAGLFVAARQARSEITREEFVTLLQGTAQDFKFSEGPALPTVDVKAFMEAVKRPCPIAPFGGARREMPAP